MNNPTLRKNRLSLRQSGFKQGIVDFSSDFIDPFGIMTEERFEPATPAGDSEAIRSDWQEVAAHIKSAIHAVGKELKVKTNGAKR